MLVAVCALLGLAIGSFLNVVVWRVPRGESVVRPPSACPACGHEIRPRDNVPVVSWLLLRGRCRDCGAPISRRYPLVELTTAVLFGLVAALVGLSWLLPVALYLTAVAVALALIDVDVHRLPDAIVLPSYPVVAALLALASLDPGGTADWPPLLRALLGGLAMGAAYLALVLANPAGMGLGDVKLAGVLGMFLGWFGWGTWAVGLFLPFLLGGVLGLALIALGRAGRKSAIPFGPWMLLGAAVAPVVAPPLLDWYLGVTVGA
ncbi:prepilin peptidase [Cellulomonas xiejunii]|uniref:Prepilin leader peptidase/N-methyltransferase n=1 Tax=Cellulomonas xiejunii TaxID=2968083 RepID=A0ABY5KV36_9CELL|nr:A24 family peptidase [Cellulomonas xiejunii]MCC2314818.1 prepilin peptidase [Cellulomonas xiejunii]MCC2323100.1 prepilin peptidase [Cellulomonas xiejunii]UUI73590.1 prepilin peptidase [Cellulomonas xiejunii]